MKKILRMLFVVFFLSVQWIAYGQGKTITGKVTDDTGMPLPGVSVVIDGTKEGTITDVNGQYSLMVPADKKALLFSFIGFKTIRETIASRSTINVTMEPDILGIDEVVVVGYGTMKKSDLSGASVSVSGESLKNSGIPNIDQALQGRAAGVVAVNTSGQPGASVSIRVRGQGTLNAGAEPLYVIDGVPMQNVSQGGHAVGLGDRLGNGSVSTFSGLSSINPADIESIEVLKDASATAIYGSRAANGVVLITTKKGKKGDAKFNYDYEYGVQEQAKRINVMNLRQYAEYNNQYLAENSAVRSDGNEYYNDPSLLGAGTNWQDAVFRIANKQSHQFSASGGNDKTDYYVSASYFDQEGTVVGSDFKRFTGKVNLNAQLKNWMKLGTNMSLATTEDNIGLNNSTEGIISVALRTTPDVPVYATDGSFSGDEREGSPGNINPIAKALQEENRLKRNFLVSNIYTDITFMKGLSLRTEAGLNLTNTNAYHFSPSFKYGNVSSDNNEAARQYAFNTYWEFKNYMTYNKKFSKHNVTAMLGQEVSEWSWESLRGTGTGLSSNDIHEPGLAPLANQRVNSGTGSGARASAFARLNYSFNDAYYITYTFRRDGSSNFGPENRWANFHAVAGSWRLTSEPWFNDFAGAVVNNLKLRAGWGQTGNDAIGGYLWGSSIGKMDTGLGQGFKQVNIANPFIKWEKQEQTNFGIDLSLYNSRIDMTVDMYNKESKDMLMDMELPSYMGTSGNGSSRLNPPMGNFGHIQNKGIEISLNTQPIRGRFSWGSDITFTHNKNKLIALTGTPAAAISGYGQWTDLVSRTELGQPLYNFYGFVTDGIYQNYQDVINSPKPEAYPSDGNFVRNRTVWVGDIKFKDISGPNGKPDGVINEYDRTVIGSPMPDFTMGWINTFSYDAFELSVHMLGSFGNDLMNYVGRSISGTESLWSNQLTTVMDRALLERIDANGSWDDITNIRVKNPSATAPRGVPGDPNANMRVSDRYIEDGSYVRFKSITLSYNVPRKYISPFSISSMRVYVNLQNMWTITNYSGFDPEVGASQTSNNVYGLDNGRYPSPRIYAAGLSVTF